VIYYRIVKFKKLILIVSLSLGIGATLCPV
jgi:hypothetical protein